MEPNKTIFLRQKSYFYGFVPNYDPYKTANYQCNGRCPKQKYTIIKK